MRELSKLIQPIRKRLLLILGRAVVTAIDDDQGIQRLQLSILKGEIKDKISRFQNYGFTSNPHPGAQAVAVFNGGNRNNGVVICVDDQRFRLKSLKPGEVAIYSDEGDSIVFHRGNKVKIQTKSFELNTEDCVINTKKFKVTDGVNDMTQILINWMDEVIKATTSTMLGPMKLIGAGFPSLKSKMESFKK
jgi:phage baseplate assembly protein V